MPLKLTFVLIRILSREFFSLSPNPRRSQMPCVTSGTEFSDFIAKPLKVLFPSSFGLIPSLVSVLSTNTIITLGLVSKPRNTIERKIAF